MRYLVPETDSSITACREVKAPSSNGAGRVTAQVTAGAYEKFRFRSLGSSGSGELTYGIESVAFPNVFLRMDAG